MKERKNQATRPGPQRVKKQKTVDLTLSKFELLHIRDLMSVMLPSDGQKTMSHLLAALENRQVIETMLWDKISKACEGCNIPIGDKAPDYLVAATGMTPLGVFQIASDPTEKRGSDEHQNDQTDISDLFKDRKREK